jgi:hypothetical protein
MSLLPEPSPDAVDQTELIISDPGYVPEWTEDEDLELPEIPHADEAPWLITRRGCGDSDSLDYMYSLNHYDGGY